MDYLPRYSAVGIQTASESATNRKEVGRNLQRMVELIDDAVLGYGPFGFPLKLVLFPEFSLQGLVFFTREDLVENGILVRIPGEETALLQRVARKHDLYIGTGSWLELDDRWPGHFFNTGCLIGPEGVVLKYRKVQTFAPVEPATSPHSIKGYAEPLFPVVDLPIGRIAYAICSEWAFPEVFREYCMQGAEVFLGPKAYMPPFGTGIASNWWNVIAQCRSLENVAYGVHVNQGIRIPPYSYNGGSCIVDYEGRITSQVDTGGEQSVFGHIDLEALRTWRANTELHCLPAQVRSEAYSWLNKPIFPGATLEPTQTQDINHVKALLEKSRNALYGNLVTQFRWKG